MQGNNAYANIDRYIDRLITESTPDLPIWNIESIRQGKKPHWNYIDGCMITSLLQMSEITGEKKYFDFADKPAVFIQAFASLYNLRIHFIVDIVYIYLQL